MKEITEKNILKSQKARAYRQRQLTLIEETLTFGFFDQTDIRSKGYPATVSRPSICGGRLSIVVATGIS